MTDLQENLLYIQAQLLECQIKFEGMKTTNESQQKAGLSPIHNEYAFLQLAKEYSHVISHNGFMTEARRGF